MNMTWIFAVYLGGLLYIASNHAKIRNKHGFHVAWVLFGMIPVVHFIFALCKMGGQMDSRGSQEKLALIEVLSNGISSLLLAISLFVLLGALASIDLACYSCKEQHMSDKPAGAEKKVLIGILAILFGWLGIHRFMLGDTTGGIIRIVISIVTCTTAGTLIGMIEGIIYLTKSDEDFVETYITNKKGWF
jgi:TM2 domain-containing membrane protein YozV